MPSARRATVSVAVFASASVAVALGRRSDQLGAGRASEVTGVSEFMISWVSTRTRSAWAATSSAPSSLCTGRIDSTVTGWSSRATWAEAKIAFCGTPSRISRVILRVPGGSRTAAASSGPSASRSSRRLQRHAARTAGAPPCSASRPGRRDRWSAARSANRRRSPRDSALRRFPACAAPEASSTPGRASAPSTSKPPPLGSEKRCE